MVGLVDHIELTEDIHGDAMQIHLINEAGIMQMKPSSWDCNGRTIDSFLKDKVIPELHKRQKDFMEVTKMENELVSVVNNEIVVSSRDIAENFDKKHKDVLESIRNLSTEMSRAEFSALFYESEYIAANGKRNPEYLINKKGFQLLAMGFTGSKAIQWKLKYIDAFEAMEEQLKNLAPVDSYMIDDPIECAKAWIKEEEKRMALAAEVKELTPLAEQTTKYIEKGHLIGIRALAKELNVKENLLRYVVDDVLGWRYKQGRVYKAYKWVVTEGYMETKDSKAGFTHSYFTIKGRMRIEEELEDV